MHIKTLPIYSTRHPGKKNLGKVLARQGYEQSRIEHVPKTPYYRWPTVISKTTIIGSHSTDVERAPTILFPRGALESTEKTTNMSLLFPTCGENNHEIRIRTCCACALPLYEHHFLKGHHFILLCVKEPEYIDSRALDPSRIIVVQ